MFYFNPYVLLLSCHATTLWWSCKSAECRGKDTHGLYVVVVYTRQLAIREFFDKLTAIYRHNYLCRDLFIHSDQLSGALIYVPPAIHHPLLNAKAHCICINMYISLVLLRLWVPTYIIVCWHTHDQPIHGIYLPHLHYFCTVGNAHKITDWPHIASLANQIWSLPASQPASHRPTDQPTWQPTNLIQQL